METKIQIIMGGGVGGLWGTYPGMFQVTDKIANGVGAFCSILISMSETTYNFCTDLPDMTKPCVCPPRPPPIGTSSCPVHGRRWFPRMCEGV